MGSTAVFKQVKKMGSDSPISLLGSFAKVISMNSGVLGALFGSEKDQAELDAIRTVMGDHEIDIKLLKQGAPLLNLLCSEKDKKELEDFLREMEAAEEPVNSARILEQLLSWDIPELELVKKGNSMTGILEYSARHKESASMPRDDEKKKDDQTPEASKQDTTGVMGKAVKIRESEETKNPKEPEISERKTKEERASERGKTAKAEEKEGSELSERDQATKLSILVSKVRRLTECLKVQIKGQNEAIRLFAEGYFQSEVFPDETRKGPSTTFLFAGPPGVGKTFLAETAAENLNMAHLRLDMSEFSSNDTVKRLVGTEKHYQGSKPGVLTSFVKEHPRSIILLDEIEKASEDIIYQFLQVLDGGVLTDAMTNEQIDFKNTILIFTTNVGRSLYENRDRINLSGIPRSVVMKALEDEKDEYRKNRFPAAICSRFAAGNVIMFNHLETHILQGIVNQRFEESAKNIHSNYSIETEFDPKVSSMFLYSQSVELDARKISSQSTILVKNELLNLGRNIKDVSHTVESLKTLRFKVELPENDPDICRLFENEEVSEILIFGEPSDYDTIPFSDKCKVYRTNSIDETLKLIGEKDIDFMILDLKYGSREEMHKFLSMDDWDSEGVNAFNEITEKAPHVPLYLLQRGDIQQEDQNTFTSRGVRGFLDFEDKVAFADTVARICDQSYMQKKIRELSGRGRVLSYNTAQRVLEDGETAEIIFRDFRTCMAVSGEENQMMLGDNNRPKDRFEDVIGAETAKEDMKDFINFLKNPKKYTANGSRPPVGLLLYGPPGTGKTMLARAMAGECEVPFFATTATGFMDRYFGESERKIRQIFATARKFAPSIIFIDEIDAIARERTGSEHTKITEDMLNTILTEMDGFQQNPSRPVFLIVATNTDPNGGSGKGRLDGAFVRRFDKTIYIDLPKEEERLRFLKQELAKVSEHQITEEALKNIATRTVGESLSTLKSVLDLALRKAVRDDTPATDQYLLDALEEFLYGEKHENKEEYYKTVSYHESGHAYIYTLGGFKPSFVTIVSRGNFGGYMQHENSEDTPSYTKEQLLWRIRTALAGRAAEIEFFGEEAGTNTGISSDIQSATSIAMNMVSRYAMAEDQLISLSPEQLMKTPMAEKFLERVNTILQQEMQTTRELVHAGRDKIEALALFLQKQNQATEEEIREIFNN